MIKYLHSVQKLDHCGSVAVTFIMIKKGLEELDQYTLTRSEYADSLGISPNCVRMRMRHGKLDGQYRFDGNKFLFKPQERPRDYIVNDHSKNIKLTTRKKKYNRGNHFKADYPNDKFRQYNELKMLNKIKGNLPDSVINEINPELIKLAEERAAKKKKDLEEKAFTQPTNYGGPLRTQPRPRSDMPVMDDNYGSYGSSYNPFKNKNWSYDGDGSSDYDDGSVEVNISRSSASHTSEPRFANAVEEAIWRNKNRK